MLKASQLWWVCHDCGTYTKNGKMASPWSTWHVATCDCCGRETPVTECRDYGYFTADEVMRMEARAMVLYGDEK